MTRQIAEITAQAEGVRFHITSLNPIHPANEADPWERESLGLFETTGLGERMTFVLMATALSTARRIVIWCRW